MFEIEGNQRPIPNLRFLSYREDLRAYYPIEGSLGLVRRRYTKTSGKHQIFEV